LGKLGGRELTVTSDLDIVLVYSLPAKLEQSDGPKPLSPSHYYARLASRFVTALSAATAEGSLYEMDLRLRPQGAKGPLASEIAGFAAYATGEAWTWEHMALTRARVVCGGAKVSAAAMAAIGKALAKKREPATLAAEIADMRLRMAGERKAGSVWQIKDWRGGLVDVEFLVQHAILQHPALVASNTAEAIAKLAAAKVFSKEEAATLSAAHALYSAVQALLRLTVDDAFDAAAAPEALKALLVRATGTVDFSGLEAKLETCAAAVRTLLEKRLPGAL
jgi:glutamate-ammonia-ligase adenylyltransferase